MSFLIRMPKTPVVAVNPFHFEGLLDLDLSLIQLTGVDCASFLQSQMTQDIRDLKIDHSLQSCFLTAQGRMIAPFSLTRKNDGYYLLVEKSLEKILIDRIEHYLVSEDVEIAIIKTPQYCWLGAHHCADVGLESYFFYFYCQPILLSAIPPFQEEKILTEHDFFQTVTLQTGLTRFTQEQSGKVLLNETRWLEIATSENKGCYPGQETVNKIRNNRGAAYYPAQLNLKNSSPLKEGETLFHADEKLGTVLACDQNKTVVKMNRLFRVEGLELELGDVHLFQWSPEKYYEDLFNETSLLYAQGGDINQTIATYRFIIRMHPAYSAAYEGLAVVLTQQEKFDQALALLDELEQLEPDSVMVHTNRSIILAKMGKIEEAEAEKVKATVKTFRQKSKEKSLEKQQQELEGQKKKEREQRAQMFYQVLEIDPDDEVALLGLGEFFWDEKQYHRARGYLQQLVEKHPKISKGYLLLGKVLKGMGELEQAHQFWQDGVRVASANGDLMPANEMQALLNQSM